MKDKILICSVVIMLLFGFVFSGFNQEVFADNEDLFDFGNYDYGVGFFDNIDNEDYAYFKVDDYIYCIMLSSCHIYADSFTTYGYYNAINISNPGLVLKINSKSPYYKSYNYSDISATNSTFNGNTVVTSCFTPQDFLTSTNIYEIYVNAPLPFSSVDFTVENIATDEIISIYNDVDFIQFSGVDGTSCTFQLENQKSYYITKTAPITNTNKNAFDYDSSQIIVTPQDLGILFNQFDKLKFYKTDDLQFYFNKNTAFVVKYQMNGYSEYQHITLNKSDVFTPPFDKPFTYLTIYNTSESNYMFTNGSYSSSTENFGDYENKPDLPTVEVEGAFSVDNYNVYNIGENDVGKVFQIVAPSGNVCDIDVLLRTYENSDCYVYSLKYDDNDNLIQRGVAKIQPNTDSSVKLKKGFINHDYENILITGKCDIYINKQWDNYWLSVKDNTTDNGFEFFTNNQTAEYSYNGNKLDFIDVNPTYRPESGGFLEHGLTWFTDANIPSISDIPIYTWENSEWIKNYSESNAEITDNTSFFSSVSPLIQTATDTVNIGTSVLSTATNGSKNVLSIFSDYYNVLPSEITTILLAFMSLGLLLLIFKR